MTRVMITGIGAVSGLGIGVEPLWRGLVEGRSGLGPIRGFDASAFPSALGGEAGELPLRDSVPKAYRKAIKVMARDTELAVLAAQLAALDAGVRTRGSGETGAWTTAADAFAPDLARAGCQIGAGLVASEVPEMTAALATSRDERGVFSFRRWGSEDGGDGAMNNLPPLWMLKYLPNMLACHVTIIHGLEGPSNTITCAEASGLLSVGEAARVIERGDADLCFAGGAESKLNPMGMMRLWLAGRLAETDAAAREAAGEAWRMIRPYDDAAPGSLVGEAGVILTVESAEHAQARGARVYAEIAGFGAGQAVDRVFAGVFEPAPAGHVDRGLERAIRAALADAKTPADGIDAIVPAALGVRGADTGEANAFRAVFGARLGSIPLITVTGATGLTAAAHSAVQLAAAACALHEQRLPARRHAGAPAGDLRAEACASRPARLRRVLVCGSALGGQSGAMVLAAVG